MDSWRGGSSSKRGESAPISRGLQEDNKDHRAQLRCPVTEMITVRAEDMKVGRVRSKVKVRRMEGLGLIIRRMILVMECLCLCLRPALASMEKWKTVG